MTDIEPHENIPMVHHFSLRKELYFYASNHAAEIIDDDICYNPFSFNCYSTVINFPRNSTIIAVLCNNVGNHPIEHCMLVTCNIIDQQEYFVGFAYTNDSDEDITFNKNLSLSILHQYFKNSCKINPITRDAYYQNCIQANKI